MSQFVSWRAVRAPLAARLFSAVSVLGLAVRLTVRDRFPGGSLVFYLMPWAVVGLVVLLSAALWWRARRRLEAKACAILGVILCLFAAVWTSSPGDASVRAPAGAVRVMLWNVARASWQRPRIALQIQANSPDVLGLVEVGPWNEERARFWKNALEGWRVSEARSGMLLASKYPIDEQPAVDLGPRGRCRHFVISLSGEIVHVLLVDIKSNPLLSRREPLERLAERVRALGRERLIVMGDFNTPEDSAWFEPLRENCRNAFEAAGAGYAATWPVPFPVLQLDHIWVGAGGAGYVASARHEWSIASDHRAVVAEIAWGRNATPARLN